MTESSASNDPLGFSSEAGRTARGDLFARRIGDPSKGLLPVRTRTALRRIKVAASRSASELNPKGSFAALDSVIARALAKKPEERSRRRANFASALEVAFKDGGDPQRQASVEEPASRTIRTEDNTVVLSASLKLAVEDLRAIETLLTLHVGPMAKLLLKQSARTASDGATTREHAREIHPDRGEQEDFIIAARKRLAASTAGAGGRPHGPFLEESDRRRDLEVASKRLARYLGPIAKGHREEDAGKADRPAGLLPAARPEHPRGCGPRPFSQDAGYREVGRVAYALSVASA